MVLCTHKLTFAMCPYLFDVCIAQRVELRRRVSVRWPALQVAVRRLYSRPSATTSAEPLRCICLRHCSLVLTAAANCLVLTAAAAYYRYGLLSTAALRPIQ